MNYTDLSKAYPELGFEDFTIEIIDNNLETEFFYKIKNLDSFKTKWIFPIGDNKVDTTFLKPYIFALGMAELISFWKITCAPTVIVNPKIISTEEINWWKKLYFHGLGEFFYLNDIHVSMDSFMEIKSSVSAKAIPVTKSIASKNYLSFIIPVGGGKDSIVSLELLKPFVQNSATYLINYKESSYREAEIAGFSEDQIIVPTRIFDSKIVDYNKKGFLNGHTPFSSIVAFSALISAIIYKKSNIALSNEASANEPSVIGSNINHQYSKSFEFEEDFNYYVKTFLHSNINYFSFLRVFHEIQIAAIFSTFKKYHNVFKSCNVGTKTDSWCGKCAKCLFVVVILSPFISQKEIIQIVGTDMLNNSNIYPILLELAGKTQNKPFECVGTVGEVEYALSLIINNIIKSNEKLPVLLETYKTDYGTINTENLDFFGYFNDQNLIPPELLPILKTWKDEIKNEYTNN